ncbi:MAG: glycosyltransferase [Terriglobia bacterium]
MSIACSIGIMAYNEEANIGRMLEALVSQRTAKVTLTEIVVVASGCTDCTEPIVQDWATREQRIRLMVQPRREGKASAINQFLPQARERIVVLCGADLLRAAGGLKRSADLKNGNLTRYYAMSGASPGGKHQTVDLTAVFHDTSLNFPPKDGDVLSVPQLPRWNDLGAAVSVSGEITNPGVYGIRPGERLSSVLKRAGGLLPTAYPQGAIFTRRAVRELQEKSRQELI